MVDNSNFMDMNTELFARRLREVCYNQGCNIAELSRATGITPSLICYYMDGKKVPNLKTVYKMAAYLGISIDYLTGNDEAILSRLDNIKDLFVLERDDKARRALEEIEEIKKYYKGARY